MYNGTNTYTPIDYPGAASTQPLSLNNLGQVVGSYVDLAGINHGFGYSNGGYSTFDGVPDAPMSLIQDINDSGQIVGFATVDDAGTTVGFTAVTPEPASLSLAGLGLLAVGAKLRHNRKRAARKS